MEQWSKFENNSRLFIVKFCRNKNTDDTPKPVITCWLSDFTSLWTESIETNELLIQRIATENPCLVIDGIQDKILNTISAVGGNDIIKIEENAENGQLTLNLKYNLPLKIRWLLDKCDEQMFFNQVTSLMLRQVYCLQQNNDALIDIIKKKDQEIVEYKLDRAKPLTRPQFTTKPFDASTSKPQFSMFDCAVAEFSSLFAPIRIVDNEESASNADSREEIAPLNEPTRPKNTLKANKRRQIDPVKPKLVFKYGDDEESATDEKHHKERGDANTTKQTTQKVRRKEIKF